MAKRKRVEARRRRSRRGFRRRTNSTGGPGRTMPPTVSIGTVLHDEWRGDMTVDGFTKAPIPWPAAEYQHGRADVPVLPILCGDLVRAVCEEDELTVAHYWGVTRYIVEQWKRAISGATTPMA